MSSFSISLEEYSEYNCESVSLGSAPTSSFSFLSTRATETSELNFPSKIFKVRSRDYGGNCEIFSSIIPFVLMHFATNPINFAARQARV